MNGNLQRYLRAIQSEIGASAASEDRAPEHMAFCLRSLIARLVVQAELEPQARLAWREALPPLLQWLRDHQWAQVHCESSLAELDALIAAAEIAPRDCKPAWDVWPCNSSVAMMPT